MINHLIHIIPELQKERSVHLEREKLITLILPLIHKVTVKLKEGVVSTKKVQNEFIANQIVRLESEILKANKKTVNYINNKGKLSRIKIRKEQLTSWEMSLINVIQYITGIIYAILMSQDIGAKEDIFNEFSHYYLDAGAYYLSVDDNVIHMTLQLLPIRPELYISKRYIKRKFNKFLKPSKELDYMAYGYNKELGIGINVTKSYPPNKLMSIIKEWESLELPELSDTRYNEVYTKKNLAVNVLRYQSQERFGRIMRQVLALMYAKQIISEADVLGKFPKTYLKECNPINYKLRGHETVGIQAIRGLMSQYNLIPWRKTRTGYEKRDGQSDFPVYLPTLIIILSNLGMNELMVNITHNEALLVLDNIVEWMDGSPFDNALEKKSPNRAGLKLLNATQDTYAAFSYDNNGAILTGLKSFVMNEYFFKDERKNLELQVLKANSGSSALFNRFRLIMSGLGGKSNLDNQIKSLMLRRAYLVLGIASTPSIYYHGDTVFAYEASAKPRLRTMEMKVQALKSEVLLPNYVRVPYESHLSNNSILERANDIFWNDLFPIFSDHLSPELDPERALVSSLTTNSQGYKLTVEEAKMLGIPEVLAKSSQNRLLYFLARENDYYDIEQLLKMSNVPAVAGNRSQIDRRYRVIVMVPNSTQLTSYPLLVFMNAIKPYVKEIAVGKQIGTAQDMLFQLSGTDGSKICNSMDVSGMDTHTLNLQQDFINDNIRLAMNQIPELKYKNYFAFGATTMNKITYGEFNATSEPIQVSPLSYAMLIGRSSLTSSSLIFSDKVTRKQITVSGASFASGLFGTSSQHTILLKCVLDAIKQEAKPSMSEIEYRVMGDDIIMNCMSSNQTEYDTFFTHLQERLLEINYDIEVAGSRRFGVFLQQGALNGSIIGYPHRMSCFTNETGSTLRQNHIQRMKDMRNFVGQYSVRSQAEENGDGFLWGCWEVLRTHFTTKKIGDLKFSKLQRNLRDGLVTILPISVGWSKYLRIGLPIISMRNLHTMEYELFGPSYSTSLKGDFAYVEIGELGRLESPNLKGLLSDILNVNELETMSILSGLMIGEFQSLKSGLERKLLEIGEDLVNTMIHTLEGYQDQMKRMNSITAAKALLNEYGITLPTHLTYHLQPKERIHQSIEDLTREDSSEDFNIEFYDFWLTTERFEKWMNELERKKKFMLSYYVPTNRPSYCQSIYTYQKSLNEIFNLASGLDFNGLSHFITRFSGYVFDGTTGYLLRLGAYFNIYSNTSGVKLTDVVELALRHFSNGNFHIIRLIGTAAGLSDRGIADLLKAVQEMSSNFPMTEIGVIADNPKNFYRSMSVENFREMIDVHFENVSTRKLKARARNLFLIFTRELLYRNPINFITKYENGLYCTSDLQLMYILSKQ